MGRPEANIGEYRKLLMRDVIGKVALPRDIGIGIVLRPDQQGFRTGTSEQFRRQHELLGSV